ncbi:MAG TPA: TerB family tellurite resistance protein, partial [Vicinamibacterales bacterium]|nr:TerB family tellurite resistance protein [Vicinamibacterales bacterium]
ETSVMERLVRDEGGLTSEQAMLVVSLAKTSNLLFGGTADFEVARDFAASATYDEKLALARCLFAVAASEDAISMTEETEIHRILNQLKIQPNDLIALRVANRAHLPGLSVPRKD